MIDLLFLGKIFKAQIRFLTKIPEKSLAAEVNYQLLSDSSLTEIIIQ